MVKLFSKNPNLCDHNPPTSQTDRRTDGQTDRQTTCDRNTALCTKVHRAVKSGLMCIGSSRSSALDVKNQVRCHPIYLYNIPVLLTGVDPCIANNKGCRVIHTCRHHVCRLVKGQSDVVSGIWKAGIATVRDFLKEIEVPDSRAIH